MKNILLIGQPASGKGTQANILSEKYQLKIIDMGSILRQHKKEGTDIGKLAEELDKDGKLMPDETIKEILKSELEIHIKDENIKGFIFDGVVRTIDQAHFLDSLIQDLKLGELHIINIEIDDDTVLKRALKRGKTSKRIEDSDEYVIRKRINVFTEKTEPVLKFYRYRENFIKIDGAEDMMSIFSKIANKVFEVKKDYKKIVVNFIKENSFKVIGYSSLLIGILLYSVYGIFDYGILTFSVGSSLLIYNNILTISKKLSLFVSVVSIILFLTMLLFFGLDRMIYHITFFNLIFHIYIYALNNRPKIEI